MKARIYITLKNGVLDPQGMAVQSSLRHLGFDNVVGLRQGKMIDVELDMVDETAAMAVLADMCQKLLANTVIEDYSFEILPDSADNPAKPVT